MLKEPMAFFQGRQGDYGRAGSGPPQADARLVAFHLHLFRAIALKMLKDNEIGAILGG